MNLIIEGLLSIPMKSMIPHLLAYIDPGTGSIILQAIAAAVVGVAIAVKVYWFRLLQFFGIKPKTSSENPEDPAEEEK